MKLLANNKMYDMEADTLVASLGCYFIYKIRRGINSGTYYCYMPDKFFSSMVPQEGHPECIKELSALEAFNMLQKMHRDQTTSDYFPLFYHYGQEDKLKWYRIDYLESHGLFCHQDVVLFQKMGINIINGLISYSATKLISKIRDDRPDKENFVRYIQERLKIIGLHLQED